MKLLASSLAAAAVLAAGCATAPPAPPAKPLIEMTCVPNTGAPGGTVQVRNNGTMRLAARVLFPNGLIRFIPVAPGQAETLMNLTPEQLPCAHPLKLLDWSIA